MQNADRAEWIRTARCACGEVSVVVRGEPQVINACACHRCQTRSGSSFTYTAFFIARHTEVTGQTRLYRETRASGRWHESHFCPRCGVSIMSRLEAFPDYIGIAVGCFSDGEFPPPSGLYWASRRHHWLAVAEGISMVERQ
jgi:hypothetical protein